MCSQLSQQLEEFKERVNTDVKTLGQQLDDLKAAQVSYTLQFLRAS
jgi:hypothetical protein